MMKRFKILTTIFLISGSAWTTQTLASPNHFAQDSAHDMLQGGGDHDDENADHTSTWGTNANKVSADAIAADQPTIQAIDESSFSSEGNRAPASMRGPAAVKEVQVKSKPLPSAKTMVRTMKQKKAFQEAAVIVNDLGFFPSTLFVTQGIPVRLFVTGASQRSQCMILDAFGVRRQIRNQKVEEVIFTPDQAGKFAFTCPMNGARGTIIVKELEVAQRLPASDPIESAMAEKPKANKAEEKDEADDISDSDFGVEFRIKP